MIQTTINLRSENFNTITELCLWMPSCSPEKVSCSTECFVRTTQKLLGKFRCQIVLQSLRLISLHFEASSQASSPEPPSYALPNGELVKQIGNSRFAFNSEEV